MRRVGSGHLKVDAARAVGKLREYQLADRALYLTEMARGVVAAGATEIAVSWDADDMWLTWRGPALPTGPLESLFDALVSPTGVSGPLSWQRPLAVGVNTAIGIGPKHVDVHSISEEGESFCVRFGPRFHDAAHAAGDESGVALGERRPSDAAERVGGAGGAIHVRRRFDLETVGRFFSKGEPPEIGVLRESARWPRVALRLGEEVMASERELLRHPLPIARGFLAVGATEAGHPLHLSERGFVLERLPLAEEDWTRRTPLRVHVDYDRLPTNAARSQVRMDEASMRQLRHVLDRSLPEFCALWAGGIDGDEALRRAALEFVAGYADAATWRSALPRIPSWAAPLLAHPLARDALGRLRALSELSSTTVHLDAEPVDEALAPWFGDILWAPPGSAERVLLGDREPKSSDALLRRANAALTARRAWLSTVPREPRLDVAHPWVTLRFGPQDEWGPSSLASDVMEGLTGEVCLLDPAHAPPAGGTVSLMLDGRPLERVSVDFPLPFQAVVDSSALTPNAGYTGAEADEERARAVTGALVAAMRCVELMASKLARPRAILPEAGTIAPDIALPRVAMGEVLGQVAAYVKTNTKRFPWALDGAPLLECVRGEHASTVSLKELRADERVDTWIGRTQRYVPAVLHAVRTTEAGARALMALTRRPLQHYAGGEETSDALLRSSVRADRSAALVAKEEGRRGAIAWGEFSLRTSEAPSRVVLWHRRRQGDELSFEPMYLRCRVALDDEMIVPGRERPAIRVEWLERRMFEALLLAAEGTPPPELSFIRPWWAGDAAEWLLRAAAAREMDEATRARLFVLPLLPCVDAEPASLGRIQKRGSFLWGTESTLQEARGGGSPRSLLPIRRDFASVIASLTGATAIDATDEVAAARKARLRAASVEGHLRGHASPLPELGPGVVEVRGVQIEQGVVMLANSAQSLVDYRLKGRPLGRFELASPPHLHAVLDVGVENLSENLTMSVGLQARLSQSVRYAVPRLIEQLATEAPELLLQTPAGRSLLSSWLHVGTVRQPAGGKRRVAQVFEALRSAAVWKTPMEGRGGVSVAIDTLVEAHGKLSVLACEGDWLGPMTGEHSPLDHGAIRVANVVEVRSILEALLGTKVDVRSRAAANLQRRRAMEQGFVRAPTVRGDWRLKASLEEFVEPASRAASLGVGEVGLRQGPASLLRVRDGGRWEEIEIDVTPAIEVAVDGSCVSVSKGRMEHQRARLVALTAMAEELQRRTLDRLDELPTWVRDSVRSSVLRGAYEQEAGRLPVFPTTGDAWVTLDDLRDQHDRFGDVWAVTDMDCRLVPRDPERLAVRVASEDFLALVVRVGAVEATAMLHADAEARGNLLKPRWNGPRMPPREAERRALGLRRLEGECRGLVVALHSDDHHLSSMRLVRGDHPFEALPWEGEWPMWIDVSDPALSPDAAWARPVEDEAFHALMSSLRKISEEFLEEVIPPPPSGARALLSLREGWLALTDETAAGGILCVLDGVTYAPAVPRLGGGEVFPPVRGALLTRGTDVATILREAYPRLLDILVRAMGEVPDDVALTHMIYGVSAGLRPPPRTASLALPTAPASTLGELADRFAGKMEGSHHALVGRGEVVAALRRVLPQYWSDRRAVSEAYLPVDSSTSSAVVDGPPEPQLETTPRERLAMRLQHLLETLGVPYAIHVGEPSRRPDPWLLRVTGPRMLALSRSHPALLAWEGRTPSDVFAQRALRVLAAHAIGVVERAGEEDVAPKQAWLELLR